MSHLPKLSLLTLACCVIPWTVAGCGKGDEGVTNAARAGCPDSGAKVFLTAQGAMTLNGRPLEPSQLKDALLGLSPAPTAICYSREDPAGEPHPVAQGILEAMMAVRLPIGFFTDETFQTPIRPQ
jgi:hypothetical protein